MQVEWVNHAGFIIHRGETSLLIDPWIEGRVFNESWELLSQSPFGYDDFARVTHIWFSHEHPDHFQPANLRKIDPAHRARITILYQPTADGRVLKYCKSLGFADLVEIPARWTPLPDGLEVYCRPVRFGDSWLAVRDGQRTLLDLNDCVMRDSELRLAKSVVGDLDTLVTQFSIASWWANPEDVERWRREARGQLDQVSREIAALDPRNTVLAASFVRFCSTENAFMNAFANDVASAVRHVSTQGKAAPIVLYPGDRWAVGEPWDNTAGLAAYARDGAEVNRRPPVKPPSVAMADLQAAATAFLDRLRQKNSARLLKRITPAVIRLADLGETVRLSLAGLEPYAGPATPDVELGSDSLMFCFKNEFGGNTLFVNGRYRAPPGGTLLRFQRWFVVALANSRGVRYDLFSYYAPRILEKLGIQLEAAPV